MNAGKVIVIVAPSGTGKSTLIKKLEGSFPQLEWSVSCTTRPPRQGEEDGKDYYFLSVDEFEQRMEKGEFIEWARVHENYYGTLRSKLEQGIIEGRYFLLDIDVQGADSIKSAFNEDSAIIFIEPPSIAVLAERLHGRGTDSPQQVKIRLNNALDELKRKNDYDYLVMNDEVDRAADEIKSIFKKIIR